MASLKCANCGFGIHYHNEPNGTEFIAISQNLWDTFSNTDKPIVRYLLDGNDDYYNIWKCKQCGCIHIFRAGAADLKKSYIQGDGIIDTTAAKKYFVFEDTLFEDIAEKGLNSIQFFEYLHQNPTNFCYALASAETIVLYSDQYCNNEIRKYISLKE